MNTLYADLEFRGLIKQVTDESLQKTLANESITLYCGFDPTSDSLHIGNLLPLLALRRFQLAGHRPIAVAGGATGMIGDPSGKSQERSLQTDAQVQKNLDGIKKVISKFLDFSGPHAAILVNNGDWFRDIGYIDFLRDIGKHFTINHMMAKESVRARLEDRDHGISYTEFSYMLLQAYDFYHLHQNHGCRLQIGGSDQWGNITAGGELIRRMEAAKNPNPAVETAPVYGLTFPLVTKSDGSKFGKSESGAIWLSPEKTSPFQFYQYFIQTADADVIGFIKFFTFLSKEEILLLENSVKTAPEKREAQTRLARELTLLVHGAEELKRAEAATQALFTTEIKNLDGPTLLSALEGAPNTTLSKDRLSADLFFVDLLSETALCSSKGAARKDIQGGGIYLNNDRVSDPQLKIESSSLIAGKYLVLRKGKKTYHLVTFQ